MSSIAAHRANIDALRGDISSYFFRAPRDVVNLIMELVANGDPVGVTPAFQRDNVKYLDFRGSLILCEDKSKTGMIVLRLPSLEQILTLEDDCWLFHSMDTLVNYNMCADQDAYVNIETGETYLKQFTELPEDDKVKIMWGQNAGSTYTPEDGFLDEMIMRNEERIDSIEDHFICKSHGEIMLIAPNMECTPYKYEGSRYYCVGETRKKGRIFTRSKGACNYTNGVLVANMGLWFMRRENVGYRREVQVTEDFHYELLFSNNSYIVARDDDRLIVFDLLY